MGDQDMSGMLSNRSLDKAYVPQTDTVFTAIYSSDADTVLTSIPFTIDSQVEYEVIYASILEHSTGASQLSLAIFSDED